MSGRKRQPQPSTSTCTPKRQRTADNESLGPEHQGDVFCSHCGDTILRDRSENIEDKTRTHHKDCTEIHLPKCKDAVVVLREKYVPAERLLCMGINVNFLYGTKEKNYDDQIEEQKERKKRKEKRSKKINELLKNASALRNSDSGVILIQLVGLSPEDSFTGAFDEFADDKLNGLIEDGSMFVEVYKKVRMSKLILPDVDTKKFYDFLVLYVGGSNVITTSNFATKVSLDLGIMDPSPYVIVKFLKEKKLLADNLVKTDMSDLTRLQESREIQLKGVDKLKENEKSNLAEHVWTNMRLRDYICAFSKNVSGGSYFLGIGETPTQLPNCKYTTMVNNVHGMSHSECEAFTKEILQKVKERLLVCTFGGHKLDDIELLSVDYRETGKEGKYVVKISVKPVEGIVFHDQQGPLAYKVTETDNSGNTEDSVVPVGLEEWFQGFPE